jgi:hypothetical protein
MTRKKRCVFQRLVALGKMVHTPTFGAFEFLRASYHWRYAKGSIDMVIENCLIFNSSNKDGLVKV